MTGPRDGEQRNRYRGRSPTPWVSVRFARVDGRGYLERDLAVDTGDPQTARISSRDLALAQVTQGPIARTNFGHAVGGWVLMSVPEIELEQLVLVFATDELVEVVRQISPDFAGQVGMRFLRGLEYGGNDREFWIRPLATSS